MAVTIAHTKKSRFQKRKILPYLLVSPYLVFVVVFVAFPVFFCFFLTFNKWNIIAPMHFIGFGNSARKRDTTNCKGMWSNKNFKVFTIAFQNNRS